VLGIAIVLGLLVGAWLFFKFKTEIIHGSFRPAQLFVLIAALSAIAPLVVFTDKPSETYLYLTIGFAAILFASLTVEFLKPETNPRGRALFAGLVAVLTISFALATWVRNDKVNRCGETARQIVSGLSHERFKKGSWYVWLTPVPGEPVSHRYGMYGWRGIDTVGASAVQEALQLANSNENITARVLETREIYTVCNSTHYICYAIHDDGKVEQLVSQSSLR